jgi:hypothetical protein
MSTPIRLAWAIGGLVLLAAPAAPADSRNASAIQDPAGPPPGRLSGPPPQGRQSGPPPRGRGGPSPDEEAFNRDVRLGPRDTLDLTTLRGDIAITGIDGDLVRVSARKKVAEPNKDFARTVLQNIRVQVTERGGGVEVLTEVPEGRLPPTVVDYAIGVPYRTQVSVRSNSGGAIRVANVKGELRLEAFGGGDMTLSSVGRVRIAKAVVGSVTIEGAEGDDVNAETFGGRLQVRNIVARSMELRSISGAIAVADTLCDGTLTNEFPLKAGKAAPPSPAVRGTIQRGVFGSGSTILSVRSFTGNVSILRRTDGK